MQIRNEEMIQCNQIYRNVSLKLLGLKIMQDYYLFYSRGADLVLGIKWLVSLNIIQAN